MSTELNSYLVITALGPDQDNLVTRLTQHITNFGGHILNTRMTTLGSEFAVMLLIEGSWGAVAKIEASLPGIDQKLGISTHIRRTTPSVKQNKTMPYVVHAITNDRDGILNDVAQFFAKQDIKIEDIHAHTYLANTGTRMSSLTINVNISVATHLPTLREHFMLYCDAINLDAGLEPLRD
jgi:glycine cleavage system transcriptional repressor